VARYVTFGDPPLAGLVEGEEIVSLDRSLREAISHAAIGGLEPPLDAPRFRLSDVALHAPVPDPGAVFGIGLNYRMHAEETGRPSPERPLVFAKMAGAVTGPAGPVALPAATNALDYEGELAVVIDGHGGVFGYTVADDVTARDLQRSEAQWARAKGGDGFCPMGPWVVTADEAGDPASGWSLRTWVNGELRQDARTDDLLFGVPEVLSFIGETCTLRAGDVILTGTPAGVGVAMDPPRFLAVGDEVRIAIEGIGEIAHRVVARDQWRAARP
jgi:2-keto-4-pentenoate hydratase/2-oxohepta-3-ene-1,7-dioic acid hydratase in catechol pathway